MIMIMIMMMFCLQVRLYLPPDFSESKRYPLVINVYGGPNSQQVNDRFKLDWGTYLTTSEGIIYGLIDGRGSGFKGQAADNFSLKLEFRL